MGKAAEPAREAGIDLHGSDPRVEYVYREYVRLSGDLWRVVESSWEDFKLLGSIAAVAAWPPLSKWLADWAAEGDESPRGLVLFGGFSLILLMVAIIATRDVIKQSVMAHLLENMKAHEDELRKLLDLDAAERHEGVFALANGWEGWTRERLVPIAIRFQLFFQLVFVAFPVVVLALFEPRWYAAPYLVLALIVDLVYLSARSYLDRGTSLTEALRTAWGRRRRFSWLRGSR